MLNISVAASDGPGPVNENVVGSCATAAWVIDGATGIGPALTDAPTDAAWLARGADDALRTILSNTPTMPTGDLLRLVMSICRDALERDLRRTPEGPHEHPSAAFAMVRDMGDRIEFATLGDCRIAHVGPDGATRLFGTTALEAIEAKTIALAGQILQDDPSISAMELRIALLPQFRENRRLMNVAGGYWVLGTEPDAADHLDVLEIPTVNGSTFALASDGFLRLVELFKVASPLQLLDIDNPGAFDRWLHLLRDLEREEGSTRRYPRVKIHDDASLIRCEYRKGS